MGGTSGGGGAGDDLARNLACHAGGEALENAGGGEGEVDGAGRGELLGDGIDPRSAEAWMYMRAVARARSMELDAASFLAMVLIRGGGGVDVPIRFEDERGEVEFFSKKV
eukprot:CAMPEP_0174912354 /NCGR_PEP_ID=MMETSP0167-20121228/79740_1 /TAXON_ID=38298 /ORGANISM="Rhodella maculata, Strain CCMP736" /LENGTH=109 /DNA_ID=CAMNT_0016156999 /DNA_START=1129 /DNA_END=1460 /DNA_ORIENTATION=+